MGGRELTSSLLSSFVSLVCRNRRGLLRAVRLLQPSRSAVPQAAGTTGSGGKLFLSYRKADTGEHGDKVAVRLKELLVAEGWGVFLDQEGIEAGDDW